MRRGRPNRSVMLFADGDRLSGRRARWTVHDIGRRPQPFIGNRRIERREIDRPHRLSAEHERIVPHAFPVNLRFHRQITKTIETVLGLLFDAPGEQMNRREIARIFQRAAQGQNAARARRHNSSASSSPLRWRACCRWAAG